jgi:hypothetical protein
MDSAVFMKSKFRAILPRDLNKQVAIFDPTLFIYPNSQSTWDRYSSKGVYNV